MKIKLVILSTIILTVIMSCCNEHPPEMIISGIEKFSLQGISSASGIEFNNNSYYVVGDDNPYLFILNEDFLTEEKWQVSKIDSMISGRTPKHIKADFESIGITNNNGNEYIVIMSSGSMPGSRDTVYILNHNNINEIISKNIRTLFNKIKSNSDIPKENEINIEGLVFLNEYSYLLHRGNVSENIIIRIKNDDFINYIKGNSDCPDIDIYRFELPEYMGVPSGFSGACLAHDGAGIIFTATMEDTNNEVDDGNIIGSFIGFIPISGLNEGKYSTSLLMMNGKPLAEKIESICVSNVEELNDNRIHEIVTVTDNDDGTSGIVKFFWE